ncbi:hypothetical protein MMC30_004186 [Trapelia coarctata]|nr:hypothetical protein [Trapelia coarctata]
MDHNPNGLSHILDNGLLAPHDKANTFPRFDRLLKNGVRERSPRHTLFMVSRKDGETDGSRPNKSAAMVTNGQLKIQWRGPIVFMARKGQATNQPKILIPVDQYLSDSEDMTTQDFRDVVDILSTYERVADAALSKVLPSRVAKAVRINCPGHVSATALHTSDPTFGTSSLNCNIPFMLGLPICAQQLHLDEDWSNDTRKTKNEPFSYLHFTVTGPEKLIGGFPMLGLAKGGSGLVVRAGAEDLLPEHLEVMCVFCENTAGMVWSAAQRGDKKHIKQFAEKSVTKEKYLAFWEKYKAMKASTEARWKSLPSPYDMGLDMEDLKREQQHPLGAFKPNVVLYVD